MTKTPKAKHSRSSVQTKALAGLVAVMIAAAIVALVFVTNGNGSNGTQQAGGAPAQRDVGHTSTVTPSPSATVQTPTSAPTTSSAPTTATAPSTTTSKPAKSKTDASKAATSKAATSKAATSKAATSKAATSSTTLHPSDTKKVVYTVKKGDTLTDIGAWYSDHGYLKLYNWNKSVIGKNPNLIFPGQKIIVVDGNVGVARH